MRGQFSNQELTLALMAKLDISRSRLSQRVQTMKVHVPMSTADATYCLAQQEGIAVDKYLPAETVRRVNELVSVLAADANRGAVPRASTRARAEEYVVAGGIRLPDPVLPQGILDDARKMATTAYPMLYVFENSIRFVVAIMMANRFGDSWWSRAPIKESVKKAVRQRDGNGAEAWRSGRATHPIYFTELSELTDIVRGNWQVFRQLFPKLEWFERRVACVEALRKTVTHMNPLQKRDTDLLREELSDWWEFVRKNQNILQVVRR